MSATDLLKRLAELDTVEPGQRVLSRDGAESGWTTGGVRPCQLEGCGGTQIGVRWKNGKLTWPCTKGMRKDQGTWRIL